MALKIRYEVPTSELQPGDAVLHSDGAMGLFVGTDSIDDSEYVEVTWEERAGGLTWTSTAQPRNAWPVVVRQA